MEKTQNKLIQEIDDVAKNSSGIVNRVSWDILNEEGKVINSQRDQVCFAQLPLMLNGTSYTSSNSTWKNGARYLVYRIDLNEAKPKAWVYRWLELCALHNLINVDYVPGIFEHGFKVDLADPHMSADRLYTALCSVRSSIEYWGYAWATEKLHNDYGVGFWPALIWTHGRYGSPCHSWLGFGAGPYTYYETHQNSKKNLILGRRMQEYFSFEKPLYHTPKVWHSSFTWACGKYWSDSVKAHSFIDENVLLEPVSKAIMAASSDAEAKRMIGELNENNGN